MKKNYELKNNPKRAQNKVDFHLLSELELFSGIFKKLNIMKHLVRDKCPMNNKTVKM